MDNRRAIRITKTYFHTQTNYRLVLAVVPAYRWASVWEVDHATRNFEFSSVTYILAGLLRNVAAVTVFMMWLLGLMHNSSSSLP